MSCKKIHPFHLVEFSPWPIRVAFRAMGIVRGLVNIFDPQPIWFTLPTLVIISWFYKIGPTHPFMVHYKMINWLIVAILTWIFFIHSPMPFLLNLLIYAVWVYLHAFYLTFLHDYFEYQSWTKLRLIAIVRKVFWVLTLGGYSLKYAFNINVHTNLLIISTILFTASISLWFKDIIRERTFQGKHTLAVQKGLRWGIILFIISEVIFFASFFWAFFHRRINPSIAIGCQWPPRGIQTFNPWRVPLLNTLILLLRGATLTYAHHTFIYKGLDSHNILDGGRDKPTWPAGRLGIQWTERKILRRQETYRFKIRPWEYPWDREKNSCPFIEQNKYETRLQSHIRWSRAFGTFVFWELMSKIVRIYYRQFEVRKKLWFKQWWNKVPGKEYKAPNVYLMDEWGYYIIRYLLPDLKKEDGGPSYHLGYFHTWLIHFESIWIKFTIALGTLFIIIQLLEYLEAPFTISSSVYGRVFFLTTGFHGFHVFVGTLFLTVALMRIKKFHFTPKQHLGLEFAAWYWHFVDVIWLLLYLRIYHWGSIPEDTLFITKL